jgi:threonine dehydrogenase-like Zn-dependent dehydrogenase
VERRGGGEGWNDVDHWSLVRSGSLNPAEILTQREPMTSVIEAYKAFDKRKPGWIKVKLEPTTEASLAA